MDDSTRKRLEAFLLPLYQDLDGVSRFSDVERISRIARRIHTPRDPSSFERLLLFQGLGKWLDKVGNVSRTALAVGGVSEDDLWRTADSLRRLERPQSEDERAVASAILIDGAGVRGLAQRVSSARREGRSLLDVIREELAGAWVPEWIPEPARPWLERRITRKQRVCRELLEELNVED
jgi:hypothetical protein